MLRRTFCFCLVSILFAACSSSPTISTDPPDQSSASSSSPELVLEQLPSEFSIPHFAEMRLEGTDFTIGEVLAKNDVYTRYSITYRSNGLLITGILNLPNDPGPHSLLIFNHGYIATSVYTQGRGLKREQDFMARHGFAVLHTDYRGHAGSDKSPMDLSDDKVYDGNLEYAMDSANAILAIREANDPRINTADVGMLGHSLGGGVTLAILTAHPELVDAAVLYAPVHADVWENFTRWRREREEGDRTIEEFGTKDENPEFWSQLSPETFLDHIRAPILLFQGDQDKDVPKAWSDHLAQRLREEGKEIEYVGYAGEGHEFVPQWQDFMERSEAFFKARLAR